MSEEIIATLLEWNPWFENQVPGSLLGIERNYDITSYLSIPEIKILEGVRRSGKSTLLYQIVQQGFSISKNVLYVNFEDEILQKYSLADIYYAFSQRSSIDYLLIDEIQQCHEWVPFVRKLYDRKELEQIWITGSNSSLIKKEYAELLTGRNIKIAISTLAFSEYLKFKDVNNIKLPISKQREAQIKKLFNDYLNMGAFPAIALRSVYQRQLLNSYFEDFLYKDIAGRYDVNISKLKDLAIYLATHSSKMFSYRNIAKLLSLHANTVNDYISHMKEVFLFDEVYKFDYSLKTQYSNDKKIYMIDTGLASAVSFRFSEDKGRMLETLVFNQLKRLGNDIYFHRGNKECDFIIKDGLDIRECIQVSCSLNDEETKQREIAGLVDAIQTYKTQRNLILTLDESDIIDIEIDNKPYQIFVKPVWRWMLE